MADQGTDDDAGDRKASEHDADDKRRRAQLRQKQRQHRREHEMLRIAEQLRGAEQDEGLGPEGVGHRNEIPFKSSKFKGSMSRTSERISHSLNF